VRVYFSERFLTDRRSVVITPPPYYRVEFGDQFSMRLRPVTYDYFPQSFFVIPYGFLTGFDECFESEQGSIGIFSAMIPSYPILSYVEAHTLQVGCTFCLFSTRSCLTNGCLSEGLSAVTPSTPAVFFPWFCWVTCLTAILKADHDKVINPWSLRTRRLLPCWVAL